MERCDPYPGAGPDPEMVAMLASMGFADIAEMMTGNNMQCARSGNAGSATGPLWNAENSGLLEAIEFHIDAAMTGVRLATVRIHPSKTVRELSRAVCEAAKPGMPGLSYTVLANGQKLAPQESVAACGLHDQAVVQAVSCVFLTADFEGLTTMEGYAERLGSGGSYGWGHVRYRVHVAPGDLADLERERARLPGAASVEEIEPWVILDLLVDNPALASGPKADAQLLKELVRDAGSAKGFGYDEFGDWRRGGLGSRSIGRRALLAGHLLSLDMALDVTDVM